MIARFLCYLRHHHNPVRHPLGGFKCSDCGEAGADLEQMGFEDGGYVVRLRNDLVQFKVPDAVAPTQACPD